MSFWSQVVKGQYRKITFIDVLGHSLDKEGLKEILVEMENSSMHYGGEWAFIYMRTFKKIEDALNLNFVEYGPNKESKYRGIYEGYICSLEVSQYSETALFSYMTTTGNIVIEVKLYLQ